MLKSELINALSFNKRCLSKSTLIPIFSHFCFTPTTISSFNGVQGIVVDFETGLNCAVPGEIFNALIQNSNSEDLQISYSGNKVIIKDGKSVSKLETLPADNFVFTL